MPIINQIVKGSGGGSSVAEPYIELEVDANGYLRGSTTTTKILDIRGATRLYNGIMLTQLCSNNPNLTGSVNWGSLVEINGSIGVCQKMFQNDTGLTSVDLSGLKKVSTREACRYMFSGCTGITSINMSSLETISGEAGCYQMFLGDTGLVGNIDLSSLKTISNDNGAGEMFYGCSNITSFDLRSLETVGGINGGGTSMFAGTGITTAQFQSLKTMTAGSGIRQMFMNCPNIQSIWFYALDTNSFGTKTSQFYRLLYGVTGCTVHFPIAIQSTIENWTDVTAGFGGTNTTVLFDIVTSLTGADTNTYTRSEKNSTSTATAWVYNDTLYYTSGVSDNAHGVNEPSVSDAIYSDAACTQSVTTITAIA